MRFLKCLSSNAGGEHNNVSKDRGMSHIWGQQVAGPNFHPVPLGQTVPEPTHITCEHKGCDGSERKDHHPQDVKGQANLGHPGVRQAGLQKPQAQQAAEVLEVASRRTVANQLGVPAEGFAQLIDGHDVLGPKVHSDHHKDDQ